MELKSEITPKAMLPGSPVKPLGGGEFSSFNVYSKERISELLLSRDTDISSKIRCLFFGRFHGDEESAEVLSRSLDYSDSVLFRHEVLYVLGQMGLRSPLPRLHQILADRSEHPMVRHEAGEAIAAIGDDASLEIVESYIGDSSPAVSETCYLAAHSLRLKRERRLSRLSSSEGCANISDVNAFNTTDPTPPKSSCDVDQIGSLASDLLSPEVRLERRYAALFALRNILTGMIDSNQRRSLSDLSARSFENDQIHFISGQIAKAMETDRSSAVFRHECAFVLGQIQVISTADSLSRVISNQLEESMVRHEAAFALGSVGSNDPRDYPSLEKADSLCTQDELQRVRRLSIETLLKYSQDEDIIVAESCIVGLQTILDETGSLEIVLEQ
ncbi:EZ_heat domain-containing protein [Cryptosporidium canis]|uniref:Deoxyhypusine hydroxylase n=1 Tax=Cryptosporidium canis TaxID=195482 RepID=A0ABQ8PA76_9CRYT|nr:EZ_heat domain-containing protein [Cryptosporidium canis]KAJ1614349.1 EZ_heat domain-containing protein [Cryptosporidium canis]